MQKTTYAAPYDGMITNLPVREGETVVIGIQNSPGSTLMTLADMSVITAEVKVDETDIVNVRLGQPAEVTIDAIPKKTFKAVVTEIGNNAIVRSTGVSTSQQTSASQEAKDFKVVVTLQEPPENLRPGLSATAEDHHGHAQSCPDHSHSGSDGALAGGFESRQRRERRGAGRRAVQRRIQKGRCGQGRSAGRVRHPRSQS